MPNDEHEITDAPLGQDAPEVVQRDDEQPIGVIPVEEIPVLQGTRLGYRSAEAREGRSLRRDEKGKQTVRTAYPVAEFHHGVDGVTSPITSQGVEVGPSKVAALLEAAATAGTTLEVVD